MRKTIKTYIAVFMLLLAVSITTLTVHANYTGGVKGSVEMKDITATIATDKLSYAEGENILFSLVIDNESEYDIKGASITYDISNGLSVSDRTAKRKKIGRISPGREREMKGTIEKEGTKSFFPWAPDVMTVLVSGVMVLVLLSVAMILYYLFARGRVGHRQRYNVFLFAILFSGFLLSTMHTEAKAEFGEIVVSPVVVVPYGDEEVVIRMDITMELRP